MTTDATGDAYLKKLVKKKTDYKTAFSSTIIKFNEGTIHWNNTYEGKLAVKQLTNASGVTITWRGEVNPA